MRCEILQIVEVNTDGLTTMSWQVVPGNDNVACYLDLYVIRPGKDPVWNPEDGTAENRSGVIYLDPSAAVIPGARVRMLRGPTGTFQIEGAIDEAWTVTKLHHYEARVTEVNRTLA